MSAEVQRIAGRFEVLRELGRGGVGRVLLARDAQLGRKVAVKTLLADSGAARARFVEEAQVTGQLAHPNIVPVHALGVDGRELYLVMKLVEGRDLKELVRELAAGSRAAQREYGLRRRLRLFLKVCEAIGYAHARGVIHRDLKPANIMFSAGDEVLVLDWGLARPFAEHPSATLARREGQAEAPGEQVRSQVRALSGDTHGATSAELTSEGAVIGTPAYMPPEQADGGVPLDPRADVYALGATLYELVALAPPYRGPTFAVLTEVLDGPPPRPSAVAPPEHPVPPALESIVLRAMARERDDRYPDAAALAADVERFLDGRRPEAHQERLGELLRRLFEHHRVALGVAGGALTIALALLLAATLAVSAEERRVREAAAEATRAAEQAREEEAAARTAAAELERSARAVELLGGALQQVLAFEALATSATPLTTEEALGERTLDQHREDARAVLTRRRGDLLELAGHEEEGAEPAALSPAFAGLLRELEGLVRRVDQAYAQALLGRRPELLPARLGELDLGPQAPLFAARAALRSERRAEARAALAGASFAPGSPEARAAAALRATLEGAPLATRRAAWDAAVAAAPTWSWLYLRRGECRVLAGDHAGAREDFDAAAALFPVDAWIYGAAGLGTFPIYGDPDIYRELAAFVRRVAPQNATLSLLQAQNRVWLEGNLGAAAAALNEAARSGAVPEHVAQGWLARAALVSHAPEATAAAERAARRAVELAPDDPVALACLAEVALRRGAPDEALALSARGLARAPQDPLLSGVRGEALLAVGRAAEAIAPLERAALPALASDPWRLLAEAYLASDDPADWERGAQAARRGLAHDPPTTFSRHAPARPIPGDPRLHRVLGRLRRKQGRLAEAAVHFARAYSTSRMRWAHEALGQDLQDALSLGEVHEALGLPAEAAQCYAWAAADPRLSAEAQRRLERLGVAPPQAEPR